MPTRLILFDIDGTLINTGGAGTRALARAATAVFGPSNDARPLRVAGRTDAWMVQRIAAHHRIPFDDDVLRRFHDAFIPCLEDELSRPAPGRGVIPGVKQALSRLAAQPDVRLALLTGNFKRAARLKLECFGLWHYFVAGAFGDDALNRTALLPVALARATPPGEAPLLAADAVVVGDTPFDVEVAVTGGARAVAVATGPFEASVLRAAGAHAVLRDLRDPGALFAALNLDVTDPVHHARLTGRNDG